jgi:mannose-1-phosphate guanylyltransferase
MANQEGNGHSAPWFVVLAGGSGRRLQSVTRALTGSSLPKQFCTFGRQRSLLQETLARIRGVAEIRRTLVVANTPFRAVARRQLGIIPCAELVEQPSDRGTAPGVLLPLVHIQDHDPDATVVLLPSDHAIDNRTLFLSGLDKARRAVQLNPSLVVVGGVRANAPSSDFGWILPERSRHPFRPPCLRPIRSFVEKPPCDQARTLFQEGGLWSTFIIVARVATLIDVFRTCLPEVTAFFDAYSCLRKQSAHRWLHQNYDELPRADFSADLLSRLKNAAVLAWPVELGWADLGTPERLVDWLATQVDMNEASRAWVTHAANQAASETSVVPV